MEVTFAGIGPVAFDRESREEVEFLAKEIAKDGAYLRDPIRLDPGAVLFDVGANIGLFTMYVHNLLGGDCQIFCFEPVPSTFAWLEKNAADKAMLFPFALGAAVGTAELLTFAALPGNASMKPTEKMRELEQFRENTLAATSVLLRPLAKLRFSQMFQSKTVECVVRTLSEFAGEVDRIDLLKIDVEGAEHEVLDGADDATWEKVRQVALEANSEESASQLAKRLEAVDFDATVIRPEWAVAAGLQNYEILAAKR